MSYPPGFTQRDHDEAFGLDGDPPMPREEELSEAYDAGYEKGLADGAEMREELRGALADLLDKRCDISSATARAISALKMAVAE